MGRSRRARGRLRLTARLAGYVWCVKGDSVEIVVDTGGGGIRAYHVTATRAGRRVEITTGRSVVTVVEVTRNGAPVRSARFMSGKVIALVEHPAGDTATEITET